MREIFEGVRFNGCLGGLKVTNEEIIFEDENAQVALSWGLDTLTEEVLKPATSSVDLTFDLGGINERASFQMLNFPEVARFRSIIAQRQKVLKKQQSVARIAWEEPSADLDPESLSSVKTFYDDESAVYSLKGTTTAEPTPPAENIDEPSHAKALSRASILQEESTAVATEPTAPLAIRPVSNHEKLSTGGDDDLTEESMHLESIASNSTRFQNPVHALEDSVATIQACNKLHNSRTSRSFSTVLPPSPQAKERSKMEPNELAASNTPATDGAREQNKEFKKKRNAPNSINGQQAKRQERRKTRSGLTGRTSVVGAVSVVPEADQRDRRRSQKVQPGIRTAIRRDTVASSEVAGIVSRVTDTGSPAVVDTPIEYRSNGAVGVKGVGQRETSEDIVRAKKENRASIKKENTGFDRSMRKPRITIPMASHQTTRAPGATTVTFRSQVPVAMMDRSVSDQCPEDVSEKSNDKMLGEDPTEDTMPDRSSSDHYRHSPDTLVEATLVEEEPSSQFDFRKLSAVASPVDVVSEETTRRKMKMWVGLVCGCSVLIMIVVLIVSFTVAGNKDAPTIEDDLALTPEERFSFLEAQLQDVLYDSTSLEDPASPQSQALQWMAFEDKLSQNLINSNMDQHLHQRYLLAVFYFSMAQQGRWLACQAPETGESSTCIHPVIETITNEGMPSDQRMSEPAFRWLSSMEECRWAGVKCVDGVNVSKLGLARYGLQGTLPAEIGYLSTLQELDLQDNRLSGHLPSEWGTLTSSLESIRLDRNGITGSIPTEWCSINAEGLRDLVLSNNALTGKLPSCLGDLQALEHFAVLHNTLSGDIPSSFANLSHLQQLHLAGNSFSGKVPVSFCTQNEGNELLFEATADCAAQQPENSAAVECSCCTTCCVAGEDEEDCNARLLVTFAERFEAQANSP